MATFTAQVVDLVGAFSDETALDSFITEGANEVINAMPRSMQERVAEETAVTTGTTTSEGHKVLYMLRTDGTIDQPCRRISASQRGRVADSDDMEYATTSDPAYYVKDGKFNILPSGAGLLVSIPTYSQTSPLDASSLSTITNFPNEAEYLVTLYAAIKALQQNMSGKTSNLPADITFPSIPIAPATPSFDTGAISVSSSAPTYTKTSLVLRTSPTISDLSIKAIQPSSPSTPSFFTPTISAITVSDTTVGTMPTVSNIGASPTYTKQTLTTRVSFEDFFNLLEDGNPFGDTDPNSLGVTAVPPSTPSAPAFTTPNVLSVLISNTGTPPTYTAPVVGGTAEELTTGMGTGNSQVDFSDWFDVVGDYIQTEEDTELAAAQIQKISTYLQAYSGAMQNQLNVFNDANAEYQGKLQEAIQQAQINAQEAQNEANLKLQEENQQYAATIQKYQADVGKYQAEVNHQIQEYTQKLARYQLEMSTAYTAWAKTESDSLQKYQTDIQNELNEFNKENVDYQGKLQEAIQQAQIDREKVIQQAQISSQTKLAQSQLDAQDAQEEATLKLQKEYQEYQSKLNKYSNEVQSYQAQVNKEVQEYQINLDGDLNVWNFERQTDIQKYSSDIQNELNEFNKEQTVFQNELQEKVQEAQNQQTKDSSEYASKLQKYSNEMQGYVAEVNKSVQDFSTKLQKHTTDYGWLQSQHQQLSADYQRGIQLLTGGVRPQ